jgi:hypothetical protein
LPWLFGAGIILACEMLVALVIRWGFRRHVPGGAATPITDAPSVLHLAELNAGEIRQLKARVSGILLLMNELTSDEGGGGLPDARQAPRNAIILQFPGEAAKGRGGSQAGLCPAS